MDIETARAAALDHKNGMKMWELEEKYSYLASSFAQNRRMTESGRIIENS